MQKKPHISIQIEDIKKLVLEAIFLDDELSQLLTLKGGTALELWNISQRLSKDIDFSIKENIYIDLNSRLKLALEKQFNINDFEIFHYNFEQKPHKSERYENVEVKGYRAIFKFLKTEEFKRLNMTNRNPIEKHQAFKDTTGLNNVVIEISNKEFIEETTKEYDGISISIYTPVALLFEKLRAICQQMSEYKGRSEPTQRARDFFDIYVLNEKLGIMKEYEKNKNDYINLIKSIFSCKQVDLMLIKKIVDYRDFHKNDFNSLIETVNDRDSLKDYDYYFDYVISEIVDRLIIDLI